jgi:hypothetical protein
MWPGAQKEFSVFLKKRRFLEIEREFFAFEHKKGDNLSRLPTQGRDIREEMLRGSRMPVARVGGLASKSLCWVYNPGFLVTRF